jgi:hypothetical protein
VAVVPLAILLGAVPEKNSRWLEDGVYHPQVQPVQQPAHPMQVVITTLLGAAAAAKGVRTVNDVRRGDLNLELAGGASVTSDALEGSLELGLLLVGLVIHRRALCPDGRRCTCSMECCCPSCACCCADDGERREGHHHLDVL